MTITKTTFRKRVQEYDEARSNANSWDDVKKSCSADLVDFMKTEQVVKEVFTDDDGNVWTCTLVQPTSTVIDEDALRNVLKKHRLTNAVFKPVTTVVRDDDALTALIESGKLSRQEVKTFLSEKEGTASVRITKKENQ